MADEPKDAVTDSERKILRDLPYGDHPDSKKILDYLGKTVFNKTDEQLKHCSLAFKVAIVEVLNKRGELWEKEFQELPHTRERNQKLIVDFSSKMFAAISMDEVKPTEEITAFQKNSGQILLAAKQVRETASSITPDNLADRVHPLVTLIAKTYGIPVPKLQVITPAHGIMSDASGSASADFGVRLNQDQFFDKNSKISVHGADILLGSTLSHELMHLKDIQDVNDYKKSPDAKTTLLQQILSNGPTPKNFHKNIICRLLIAGDGLSPYTSSVADEGAAYVSRPTERRALRMGETFGAIRQKEFQPEINKMKLDMTHFVDTLFYMCQHNGHINPQDDSYRLLDAKHKKILHDAGPLTDDDKFQKFLTNKCSYVEKGIYYQYLNGVMNFRVKNPEAVKKGIWPGYFLGYNKKDKEEWHKKFTPAERAYWEKQVRKVGFNAVIHPADNKENENIEGNIFNEIYENIINSPSGPSEHTKTKEKNLKPHPVTSASLEIEERIFDPTESAHAQAQDSKRVAMRTGTAVRPLGNMAEYLTGSDSSMKGKSAPKAMEPNLATTTSPLPGLTAATLTQSPRAPAFPSSNT